MEKGSAPIILLIGIILVASAVLVTTQTNYLQNLISKPEPIQTVVPQITKSPTLASDKTSSNSGEDSPEAKTLDIDFSASGFTLQPVKSTNITNSVWWKSHNDQYGAADNYAVSAKEYMSNIADMNVLTKELISQNWATSITTNNYDFSGDSAGGPCGIIVGYIGYKNGQIRSINTEEFNNPCGAPDGSTTTIPGRSGGIYIYISDKVNIDQIIKSKK